MLAMVHTSLAKFNNFSLSSIFLTKLKKKANIVSFWYSICLYLENAYLDLENLILDFDFEINFCGLQLSLLEFFGSRDVVSKTGLLNLIFSIFTVTAFKTDDLVLKQLTRQIPCPLKLNNILNISKQSFLLFSKGLLFRNSDFFEKYSDNINLKNIEKKNILQNFSQINEKTKNFFYDFGEFNYLDLINQNLSQAFNITYNDFLLYFMSDSDYEITHISKKSKLFEAEGDDRQISFDFYEKNYINSTKYSSLNLLNESNCNIFVFGSALHDTTLFKQSIEALNSLDLIKQSFFLNFTDNCRNNFDYLDFFPNTIFEARNLKEIENNAV